MSYGPVLAFAFLLWPAIAVLGGQGYAPLIGLTGLAALAFARPRLPPAVFALLGFGFVAWAALSETWGAGGGTLISGNLIAGNFAIEARSLSAVTLTLFSALTIAASLRAASAPRAMLVVMVMLAVQAVLVLATPLAAPAALQLVYGDDPQQQAKGMQNILRSANTLALGLPLLLPFLVARFRLVGLGLGGLLLAGAVIVLFMLDAQSALLAICGMAAAMGIVAVMPRMGYRWLFGTLAGYIAAAPVVFAALIRALDPVAQALPASFRSRLWCWEIVLGRMTDAPFHGHGLGSTSQWRETYASRPEWLALLPDFWADYPIVPGHPHNMALQIWAETGMIGAVIAALSLIGLAFHLPRPGDLRPGVRFATAGLAGAAAVVFSFSYSLWNEGFWASLALAASAIILWHRTNRGAPA